MNDGKKVKQLSPVPEDVTSPLNTRSLREQVYDFIRDEMARGGLKPGEYLDLNELSVRLGISRTPLRDALLHLESEGFVSVLPRRGFRINDLSPDDIRHFYQIIGALESAVLRSVGDSLRQEDLLRMRALDKTMAEAVDVRDFDAYYAANLKFHDVYLTCSDNQRLVSYVHLLKRRLYDWPRRQHMVQAWEQHSVVEHEDFLRLLEQGDIDGAAAHLQNVHWSFQVQEPFIRAYYFNDTQAE